MLNINKTYVNSAASREYSQIAKESLASCTNYKDLFYTALSLNRIYMRLASHVI